MNTNRKLDFKKYLATDVIYADMLITFFKNTKDEQSPWREIEILSVTNKKWH